ncbi:MAG: NAD(P)-dependent oxidoreductase [Chitinophagales bacterium]|nr:MAG: NAD(P)-dependent oxidoreductase [Chitinophagales bacterium]
MLTGASGLLGRHICNLAAGRWRIHGIVHKTAFDHKGVVLHKADLTRPAEVQSLFNAISPQAVIHTAAISEAGYCQQHPEESYKINVAAAVLIAGLCAEKDIPFVFTSSDLVFDGQKGNYMEEDEVNPLSYYGAQKAEAERAIRERYPQAAICRLPLLIGLGNSKGHLHALLNTVKQGGSFKLFVDEFRSPLGCISAAEGLLLAAEKFRGIYHLGGRQRMSRYALGVKIASVMGIPLTKLEPVRQSDLQLLAPRPADVSLNSDKACAAGFIPMPIEEELLAFRQLQGISAK